MLHRWIEAKELILKKAYEGCILTKYCPIPKKNPKHAKTHALLHSEFLKQRKRGNKISFLWLLITGRKLALANSFPTFTRRGAVTFLSKFNIKMRRVQRRKQKPKGFYAEAMKQWLLKFRENVIKSCWSKPNYDEKWGRFQPSRRFNVDQVPLPFVVDR